MSDVFRRLVFRALLVVGAIVAISSAVLIVTLPLYLPYLLELAGR